MQKDIHPTYEATEIQCACGHAWETKSTVKDVRVAICAKCHPFFTGQQKFVDTAGRIDKFKKRYSK